MKFRFSNSLRDIFLIICLFFFIGLHGNYLIFKGGVILGLNMAQITGKDKDLFWNSELGTHKKSLGFTTGCYAQCFWSRHRYGLLELRYIEKGGAYSYITEFGSQGVDYLKLKYIEVPVMIGFINSLELIGKERKFIIETGLAVARLYSANFKSYRMEFETGLIKKSELSWIFKIKFPAAKKIRKGLFCLRFSGSLSSMHKFYSVNNNTSGIEWNYTF